MKKAPLREVVPGGRAGRLCRDVFQMENTAGWPLGNVCAHACSGNTAQRTARSTRQLAPAPEKSSEFGLIPENGIVSKAKDFVSKGNDLVRKAKDLVSDRC